MILGGLTSSQNWDLAVLTLGPLFLSIMLVGVRAIVTARANKNARLTARMGQGGWDFSSSFATNIGIIGSVLTVILTSGAIPNSPKILPANAYGGLSLLRCDCTCCTSAIQWNCR